MRKSSEEYRLQRINVDYALEPIGASETCAGRWMPLGLQIPDEGFQLLNVVIEGRRSMKFKVTLKDPDALFYAVQDAAREMVGQIEGVSDEEKVLLAESRKDDLIGLAMNWFASCEYLTVEIDTDAQDIRVVPRRE